jgi:hypothetical protein
MFGFVQWDNPITFALEVLLSLVIVAGLIIVVRRVNAKAAEDHRAGEAATSHGQDPQGE